MRGIKRRDKGGWMEKGRRWRFVEEYNVNIVYFISIDASLRVTSIGEIDTDAYLRNTECKLR